MISRVWCLLILILVVYSPSPRAIAQDATLWNRENIAAWCIVPFDAKQRTPAQRATMVSALGLKRVAYDWREQHVAEFEEEILQYQKSGIEFFAFWGTHPKAFELFAKYQLKPQIWLMAPDPKADTNEGKVKLAAESLLPVVEQTRRLGSKLALYNHGGWNGEPENMAAIAAYLRKHHQADHVGIVYNFHHGHAHIQNFAKRWAVMQPFIFAVNLNGMEIGGDAKGRKILHLSEGDQELEMMRTIQSSGWKGPVGIIDHRPETDSELTLRNNLAGLEWLRKELVKPGSGGAKPTMLTSLKQASLGAPEREPLDPAAHPLHRHPVNRDRIYDFYAKQARDWKPEDGNLLPAYAGLDGGAQGHWGNQNEQTWRDGRWNDMDCGSTLAGVFLGQGLKVAKAVCVHLGGEANFSACYDPASNQWKTVWQGGFLQFSDTRHGLMDGLRMKGSLAEVDLAKLNQPSVGNARYRGYYRNGTRTIFAWENDGQEQLHSLRVEGNQVIREDGESLQSLTKGGPLQWPQVLETVGERGSSVQGWPYVVDRLTLPFANPWKSLFFLGGHDFFRNGDLAICTMTGDVWRVSGIDESLAKLRWKRFAAGLHQPLGLIIVDDQVHVMGRDQITRLHDLNADGEADFYECLTNDFPTPTGGHDYICGLERDGDGNFYTAVGGKGLMRIKPGEPAEVIASGFRNPDGLGLGPDGTLTVPVSEGEWTPTSAIMQITKGSYYGYPGPKQGVTTQLSLLRLPRGIDNSSGGQTWVPDNRWGPLQGQMIHFSYGTGNHFLVLRQRVNDIWQGAAVPLPGDFASGAHRGRFSPVDGQLYVSGMTGWGTYTPEDGCLNRVRYTGGKLQVPMAFEARANGVLLTFTEVVEASAGKASQHFAQCWNYRYSAAYGSHEYSLKDPEKRGHDLLEIRSAHVLADGKQLFLEIPQLQPAGQIHLVVRPSENIQRELFLTVHELAAPFTEFPGYVEIAKSQAAQPMKDSNVEQPALKNPFVAGPLGRAVRVETAAGLLFATKTLSAKPGERLSLTLANPDVLPHNWVLLAPGSFEKVGDQVNKIISDPKAVARHYIPEVPDVLAWTDMVPAGKEFTIHFDAPNKPGGYPYICTFPGHWMVMKGVLEVK